MNAQQSKHNSPNRIKNALWKPGQSGNPAGKPRGRKDSRTIAVERAIQNTFNDLQDIPDKTLTSWAVDNTTAFYTILYPKIIPKNINVSSDGAFPALIGAALLEIAARYQGASDGRQEAIEAEYEDLPQLPGPEVQEAQEKAK